MSRIFRDDEGIPDGKSAGIWPPETPPAEPSDRDFDIFEPHERPPPPPPTLPRLFEEPPPPPRVPDRELFRPDEGSAAAETEIEVEKPTQTSKRRRRRVPLSRYAAATVGLFVAMVAADATYAALGIRSSLLDAADSFERSNESLQSGDLTGARTALEEALGSSERAVSLLRHPSAAAAALLPRWGSDVRAVAALAHASELAAQASLEATAGALQLGEDEDGLVGAIYESGAFRLDLIEAAAPYAATADVLMGEAVGLLLGAPEPSSEAIESLVDDATRRLASAARTIHTASVLGESLPGILGNQGTKRYLLTFQALGEARGTGGLIGLVGILRFRDGVAHLADIRPVLEVFDQPLAPVQGPAWFEAAYGAQAALQQPQQANVSPNYPAAAQIFMEMYEQATAVPLDGMIALDAIAFGMMLEATGAVQADGLDVEVSQTNAAQVLLHDSYVTFPDEATQNAYYGRLVGQFWSAVRGPDADATTLATQLGEAVRTQHAKLYFRNRRAHAAMSELRATGDYALYGPNTQLVFGNNYSVNKVDYFMRRTLKTVVKLRRDGTARVTTTISLANSAPTEGPVPLVGPGLVGDPPGLNRTLLSLLMPEGAGEASLVIDGKPSHLITHFDQRAPVAWQVLEVPAGGSTTARFTYALPQTFIPGASDTFAFALAPQTSVVPDAYSFRIVAPPGMILVEPDGTEAPTLKRRGTLEIPLEVQVSVVET